MRTSAAPGVRAFSGPGAGSGALAVRARTAGLAALAFVLALIGWLRLGPVSRDTLWAEDGKIFLTGALNGASVLQPYVGYLHVVPRLIAAAVVATTPTTYWAVVVSGASCVVVGLVGVLVYLCSGSLDLSRPARLGLALLTVVAPAAAHEGLGNLANLHWFFLWAAPWLFLARPRRWGSGVLLGVVALLMTMSEIQLVLFSPLLVVRLWDDRRWPMVGGVVGGLAAQILTTITTPRLLVIDPGTTVASVVQGYALQVGGGAWMFPLTPLTTLVGAQGWWVAYLCLVPPLVGALVWARTAPGDRWLGAVLLVGSLLLWAAGFWLNSSGGSNGVTGSRSDRLLGLSSLRYAIVPSLYVLAVVVMTIDRGLRGVSRGHAARFTARGIAVVATAALALGVAWSFDAQLTARRSVGPEWRASLPAAAATCSRASGQYTVMVPIAPRDQYDWSVALPCTRLPDGG